MPPLIYFLKTKNFHNANLVPYHRLIMSVLFGLFIPKIHKQKAHDSNGSNKEMRDSL